MKNTKNDDKEIVRVGKVGLGGEEEEEEQEGNRTPYQVVERQVFVFFMAT